MKFFIPLNLIVFLFSSLIFSNALIAQAPTIEQEVDKSEIKVGETLLVRYTLTYPESNPEIDFRPPAFNNFKIINRSSQDQRMMSFSFGKQKIETKKIFNYRIEALKAGRYAIGPAKLIYQNKEIRSRITRISVKDRLVVDQPVSTEKPSKELNRRARNERVFIQYLVDKTEVFRGEQINLTLAIFSRTNISDLGDLEVPEIPQSWVRAIESPERVNWTIRDINGVSFRTFNLRKFAVFPTGTEETLVIPPSKITVTIGGGFFEAGRQERLQTDAIKIKIKELPESLKSVHVGKFSGVLKINKSSAKTGEGLVANLSIKGNGFFDAIEVPKLLDNSSLKIYDPKIEKRTDFSGDKMVGELKAEYLIVPQKPGEIIIKSQKFSFFDPSEKKLRTLKFPELIIKVKGDAIESFTETKEKTELRTSIWSSELPVLMLVRDFLRQSGAQQLVSFTIPAAFLLFSFTRLLRENLDSKKRFSKASFLKDWANTDPDSYESELYECLDSNGLIRQARSLNIKKLEKELINSGFKDHEKFTDFIRVAQQNKFAPNSLKEDLKNKWLEIGEILAEKLDS